MRTLFKSTGIVRYGNTNLVLDVDQSIVNYYQGLLPKSIKPNPQKYNAHISVVRKEIPPRMDLWGKYAGEEVEFEYAHDIRSGAVYYWIDAFSKRLEEIREELGLEVSSPYITPPEGYRHTWHITIGNIKE